MSDRLQAADAPIDFSILIVSWNVRAYLEACLDSIRTNGAGSYRYEVIVVDSASSDGTTALLAERYPWVTVMAQTENVGFTRGNNLALKAARGKYLFLLNPDTEIIGDAMGQMVGYMDAHPDVGIVGPHTYNGDRKTTQSTRRRFPTFVTALFESTWLQGYAPRRVLDRFYARDVDDRAVADIDWAQGSALLVRREVYAQIGGLDERYIMFSEELDFCKRAKLAGWRVIYLGTAHIVHHGGKSTDQVIASRHVYFQTSKLRYFRKFHGWIAAFALRLFLISSYLQQILLESAKWVLGSQRKMRRERVQVYLKVIRALIGLRAG